VPRCLLRAKKPVNAGPTFKTSIFLYTSFLIVLGGIFSLFVLAFCDGGVIVNCFSKWLFKGLRGYAALLPCMLKRCFLFGVEGEQCSIFSFQGLKGLCTPCTLHVKGCIFV
jgi:hypothetical protein